MGAQLAADGVAWVVRAALARHGLLWPHADIADLEVSVRERDGVRHTFVLWHGDAAVEVPAHIDGTEMLTGRSITAGETPKDVLVIREDG